MDMFEFKRFNLDLSFPYRTQYDNFIGGKWVAPVAGRYFDNVSPITGKPFCKVAQSDAADINLALDAAHAAQEKWGKTSVAERSLILLKIADRMEQNIDLLATAETIDNGKPLRETTAADVPLALTTFATLPAASVRKRARSRKLTPKPWPTTSMSPLAWSGKSFPGTFPC